MAGRPRRVIILGAAGRDFHNFLVYFKNNPAYRVVAFTATQIPGIEKRVFPKELAGRYYKKDIPIFSEEKLPELIKKFKVDEVILAYSDLPYIHVMHKAALVNSYGAKFSFLGLKQTMLKSKKPVIAVTAVRTGCGKSQVSLKICEILKRKGERPIVIRHAMPYGSDLRKQVCQRFAKMDDLKKHKCTIEEAEEYVPHIERGTIVYAGIDYKKILNEAEREGSVMVFDGGNNDTSFIKPNLWIVLLDPLRPWHEITYYPGEINLRMADIAIINKEKTAIPQNIEIVRSNIKKYNPKATIIDANSVITVDKPNLIRNKSVLAIGDGPTLTHGNMAYGAETIAAKKYNCRIIDPRPYVIGSIKKAFEKYHHLGRVLPAMGYSEKQVEELEKIINKVPCDIVISATPADLCRIIKSNKPIARIRYKIQEIGKPNLEILLNSFLRKMK